MQHAIGFRFLLAIFLLSGAALPASTTTPEPRFERQVIDAAIEIGYGLAVGEVDGDGKPDILLADKSQIAWYQNPGGAGAWERHLMTEKLNPRVVTRFLDNVCIAARDIDGDGKVEVAVGGNWNPGETSDASESGSVHFLSRPADPTTRWTPVQLQHEPTVHRMLWAKTGKSQFSLFVLPLHGIGNKGGEGASVNLLAFAAPKDRSTEKWPLQRIATDLHLTHNLDVIEIPGDEEAEGIAIGGREGVIAGRLANGEWNSGTMVAAPPSLGVGEVRGWQGEKSAIAAIEPMHGHMVVVYSPKGGGQELQRTVLDDSLNQGHALAFADVLGSGSPQVVAGWRSPDKDGKVGIKLYTETDGKWSTHLIDDDGMACEDLKVADLDGDGRPEIIASGRATKNVVIYWNKTEA